MANLKHITVRVPEDVHSALRFMGEEGHRSIAAEVRHALKSHTAQYRFNKAVEAVERGQTREM